MSPEDVLTLIYTSGTTGPPKGVELAHRNLITAVSGIEEIVSFPPGSRVVSWLPAAHIAERAAHHYLPIVFGFSITTCEDPRQVMSVLPDVRPQWFFAVPRIWEKLKAGLETMIAGQPDEQRVGARARALRRASRRCASSRPGRRCPPSSRRPSPPPTRRTSPAWREMVGLDEVLAINVGAAPTPVEVLEFFHAIGLPLAELWGMSETCGAGTVNPPARDPDRHRRPAGAELRGHARRRRRGPDPRRHRHARLPQQARADRATRSTPTAGCTPATSASSTRPAT